MRARAPLRYAPLRYAPVRYAPLRYAALALLASTIACSAAAAPRSRLQRDVEGYAMAACLFAQPDAFLKDQGDAWASNIIQRGHGELEEYTKLGAVVKAEVGRGGMAVIVLSPLAEPKRLPIQYCAEVLDRPPVRTAIDAAIKRMAASYRRAGSISSGVRSGPYSGTGR